MVWDGNDDENVETTVSKQLCEMLRKNESTTHIFKCKSKAAQFTRNKSMDKLGEWLRSSKICPDIIKLILSEMLRRRLEVPSPQNLEFDNVNKIFESQQQIGWRPFMGGCISIEWAKVQRGYYKWIGLKKALKQWAVALIKKTLGRSLGSVGMQKWGAS